jgi:hypothetical protein
VRAVLLGLASTSVYDILVTPDVFVENSILDAAIKVSMLSVLLRGFDLLFFRDPKTPKKSMDNKKMGVRPRWTPTFQLQWDFRDIGNPHAIKRVSPFSSSVRRTCHLEEHSYYEEELLSPSVV